MRRIALGLLVVAFAVAGVFGWLRWREPFRTSRSVSSTSGSNQATARGGTPPASLAPLPIATLLLQVNNDAAAEVPAGHAVFLTVTLTGTAPEPGIRVGSQGQPWPKTLRFETPEGKPVAPSIEQLGPPFSARFADDPTAQPSPQSSATGSDVAMVDASRIHRVEFGVSPDGSSRMGPGTFEIRAVLPLDRNSGGVTQLVSNLVTLTVTAVSADAAASIDAEKARLQAAARFYLRSEKWEDAHRISLQLVGQGKPDALGYQLLGDALNGLKRDEEAVAAYNEALASLPKTFEESPDYLMARIDEVQQRLEQSRARK
jgi:hypothetical protein